jgi:hypothetical protein
MLTLSIVVCGWHFKNPELYRKLKLEASAVGELTTRLFIASHRGENEIDPSLREALEADGWRLLYFENQGWDWGAYQQFAQWQCAEGSLSDAYLFVHDDIIVRKPGLVAALIDKAAAGVQVVGNAVPMYPALNNPRYYPEDVIWAERQGVTIRSDHWDLVRGSLVFTTRAVVEKVLAKMPVKRGRRIELANASLRVFAAMVMDEFGPGTVAYLGDIPRESDYVIEQERGGARASLRSRIRAAIPSVVRRRIQRARGFGKVDPVERGSGLKLNLGSGMDSLPGYLNVARYSPIADIDEDIFDLEFEPGSVAEVLMVHVIEHIEIDAMIPLLETIHRWLRPSGQLILEFPDLIKCCRLILEMEHEPEKIQTSSLGAQALYGGEPKTSAYDLHKWGWTGTTLEPLLRKAGFSEVHVERPRFHVAVRDTRVVAVK